ncbi:hypothetical protein BCR34DRAFT_345471 [Clohesyomyces aquaticus]|uniref:Uncharacterized protein n=1 Tax=Clohesyomyces aquaticus TaxID=1231657 RepID=A0A1Y1ZKE2_9PLEO|nr:hypothetical protein BCR34DRAFT_345471 [Clohesyomyces aquaticus]
MDIPEELILRIFEAAAPRANLTHVSPGLPCVHPQRSTLYNTCLVNRQFNRIGRPLLYRHLHLRQGLTVDHSPTGPTNKLARVLFANPNLGLHCRDLMFSLRHDYEPDDPRRSVILSCATSWFKNVRRLCFIIRHGRPNEARDLIRSLPHLEDLEIVCEKNSYELRSLLDSVNIPSLKNLSVNSAMEICLPAKEDCNVPFSSLRLQGATPTPADLAQLLSHSRGLEHFSLRDYVLCNIGRSLRSFGDILLPYRDTLKSIELVTNRSALDDVNPDFPDLSPFHQLQCLALSILGLVSCTPDYVASRRLIPRLRRLIVELNPSSGGSLDVYVEEEEKWLCEFIRSISAQGLAPVELHLAFGGPNIRPEWLECKAHVEWSKSKALLNICGSCGILLAMYTGPPHMLE